ncbi:MAG: hypothetical protein ACI4HI_00270 [Lachnospiraceae bacterium]
MKQTIYGVVAAVCVLLGVFISLTLYGRYSRQNELEDQMAAAMKETMKEVQAGQISTENAMTETFLKYLLVRMDASCELTVNILTADVEHGLMRAEVVETYRHPTGQKGQLSCQKTILIDEQKQEEKPTTCKLTFYSESASGASTLYKTYVLQQGENLPQPKAPVCKNKVFCGWQTKNGETVTFAGNKVSTDQTYYACFREERNGE